MYKITVTYDGETTPSWLAQYSDELQAHEDFAKFNDCGFAKEYSTVNLFTNSGKCYTKIFYQNGKVVRR
jgi:hypothetical protein